MHEKLFSLIVNDRDKGALPDDLLPYILSVEVNKSDGWLGVVIDNYQANFSRGKQSPL
jgi:hypothetical protein